MWHKTRLVGLNTWETGTVWVQTINMKKMSFDIQVDSSPFLVQSVSAFFFLKQIAFREISEHSLWEGN